MISKVSGRKNSVNHKLGGSECCEDVSNEEKCGDAHEALHLLDLAADWVTLHSKDGKVSELSKKTISFVNVPKTDLLGDGFIQRVHVQDRVAFLTAISNCYVDGNETTQTVRLLPKAEDFKEVSSYWCELQFRAFSVNDRKAKNRKVMVIGRDVTSQVLFKQRLEQDQVEAATESVAKSQMLANMSHELRTPLNAIIGFSDMLQSDMYKSMCEDKRGEYISIINSSANHLLGVVNGFLDMSKIEAGKYEIFPEPFDLADAAKSTMSMLQVDAEKNGVDFRVGSLDHLPEMTADKRAIVQVMINVLSNAIKFTEEGGSVQLNIERVGRNIRLRVSDTGIGISKEHIDNLGQPFYQADSKYNRKYEGTGLGLSVVHGLVELHGGSVQFQSQAGEGTTVTITLPVIADIARPIPADSASDITRINHDVEENADTGFNIVRKIA